MKKKILFILIIIMLGLGIYLETNKSKNAFKEYSSKTLEYVYLNGIYDEKYKDEYDKIKFDNQENFSMVLTTFLPKGYSGDEINYIFSLSDKNINKLKDIDYIEKHPEARASDLKKTFMDEDIKLIINAIVNVDNYQRYIDYKQKNNISFEKTITYVNLNLDYKFYENANEVKNIDDILVLVNKYNYLPSGYIPKDLDYVKGAYGNNVPMKKIAKENFLELQQYLKDNFDLQLLPTTAYRGETFQKTLYDNYVKNYGKESADTFSARPGYSEHQTALSIDLKNIAIKSDVRLTDEDFKILSENAYKFGFIIRFPKGKENITGYEFENWHIRYVGKDNAKIIYENDLTLEEYIDLYIKKY